MNKKLISGFVLVLLTGFALGIPLGAILTQAQLDNLTETQIRNNIVFAFESVKKTETLVIFNFSKVDLVKDKNTNTYTVVETVVNVVVNKQALKDCIASNDLEFCKVNYLKPKILLNVKGDKEQTVKRIQAWQSNDGFIASDLMNVVSNTELNN